MRRFDLIVIGSGPGGYETAAEAAAMGEKTAIVERDRPGGTCLNRGCIPTKALCRSAEVVSTMKEAGEYGVQCGDVTVDYSAAVDRKERVVETLREGVMMELHNVEYLHGEARFVDKNMIEVDGEKYTAPQIIVASGSRPASLNIPGAELAVNSDFVLEMRQLPESIAIVGGGVIGMEFASVFNAYGVDVTVVEYASEILPGFDKEVSKRLRMALKRRGIKIVTSAQVTAITSEGVTYTSKGKEISVSAQMVMMAVGRRPVIPEGLTEIGVDLTPRGFVKVDSTMQTSVEGIFAVGDVNGLCLLAHAATAQGRVALGLAQDLSVMPAAVFTRPECAMVGLTQEQCEAKGCNFKTATAIYRSNGKALATGETDGMVKAIIDNNTDMILGFHVCGAHAADMVQEVAVCMANDVTASRLRDTIHIHPTLGELVENVLSR